MLQRLYKFGGQPFVQNHYSSNFKDTFGEKNYTTIIYATAGKIMEMGEIALLPLGVLKIKGQTNSKAFGNHSVFRIVAEEGMNLYRCVRDEDITAGKCPHTQMI